MRLMLLPAVLLTMVFLAGCGGGSTPEGGTATPEAAPTVSSTPEPTRTSPRKTTFVMFRSNLNARQGAALLAGAQQSAKKHHNSFLVVFKDGSATAESISALDAKETDAVIVAGTDPALSAVKFPIIHLDIAMEGDPGVATVATDDKMAGEMAAQEIAKLMGGKGQVLIAQEPAAYTPRTTAFAAAVAASGLEIIKGEKSDKPAAAAIYCSDESATRAMLKTLAGPNVAPDCKVIGFGLADDLLDALRAGKLAALVVPDYFETGRRAAEAARATIVAEGKTQKAQDEKAIAPLLVTKTLLEDAAVKEHLGVE